MPVGAIASEEELRAVIEGKVAVISGSGNVATHAAEKICHRGGKPVTIDFVAAAPGTYEIVCSEECGEGHDSMSGRLVVKARPKS